MPSVSGAQHRLMEGIAHGMTPRGGKGPSVKVAKEFVKADTGKKFAEGGHWIKGAIKHPGALHKEMGVPAGKKIPAAKLAKAATKGGKLGQRARIAETLSGMHKKAGGRVKCSTPQPY